MIFLCDACRRTYEFGSNSICCVLCGEYRAHPITEDEIRTLQEKLVPHPGERLREQK